MNWMRGLLAPVSACLVAVSAFPQTAHEGFARIPGGTFSMGSPASEPGRDGDEVQHQVTVSSFYLSKYEVTVADFRRFVNSTEYKTTAETSGGGYVLTGSTWKKKFDASWRNPYFTQNDNYPVVLVSWYDAVAYCNWVSRQEGLTPAYTVSGTTVTWNRSADGYRLPTEAEWEYACRAGTTTAYNTGDTITDSTGWYYTNSESKIHEVGKKPANQWGLYDMHGNVWEWCWDWYGSYSSGSQTDPQGAAAGDYRVERGGGWGNGGLYLRSAFRILDAPSYRDNILGFRLARS